MLKNLSKREASLRRDQDPLDQVLSLGVAGVREGVVEVPDSLLSVFFVERILHIEWSLTSVQQGIQDDSETPYVDSLVILALFDSFRTASFKHVTCRDEHLKCEVSWGA